MTNSGTINSGSSGIDVENSAGSGGSGGEAEVFSGLGTATGGNAGVGDNSGGVTVTNSGTITADFDAIFVDNFGKRGGRGGDATADSGTALGGTGGAGSDAGGVTVTNSGTIVSFFSDGIEVDNFADSGGDGGDAASNSGSATGGNAGAGGGNSGITVDNTGTITSGSDGIFVDNSTGGGGQGGDADITTGAGTATGGAGGVGGTSGVVTVTNSGTINSGSDGIDAFSSGGDGGDGGDATSDSGTATGGDGGDGGDSGAITVINNGAIVTQNDGSSGILAGSFSGDGGVGGIASTTTGTPTDGIDGVSGNTGDVTVVNNGDITVNGLLSSGIEIDSGSGNVQVENSGNITATDPGGFGVSALIVGGNINVDNFGTINGGLNLSGGTQAFTNHPGAVFNTSDDVLMGIGPGDLLTNAGTLSPGGLGNISSTDMQANLLQTSTGRYSVDFDLTTDTGDLLNITDGSVDLAGGVSPHPVDPVSLTPGVKDSTITILTSFNAYTNSGLSLQSGIISGDLLFPTANVVEIHITGVNFSPAGVGSANQARIGDYFNRMQLAGGSPALGPLYDALFDQPDAQGVGAFYDHLNPEVFQIQQNTLFSNLNFNNAMLSCRKAGGDFRFVSEGECGWMVISGRSLERDRTPTSVGFDETAFGIEGGLQKAVTKNWTLGFGLSYENTEIDAEDLSETDGDKLEYGLIAKGRFGATTVSVAVSGGHGWYDTDRFVLPGTIATSDQRLDLVSGHLRASYLFEQGPNWYWLPMLDFGVTHLMFDGFTETGAGAANLTVFSHDDTYYSLQPSVEVGGEYKVGESLLRPFIKVGLTQFFGDTSPEVSAIIQGSPAGVAPFTVTGEVDETFGDVEVGALLLKSNKVTLRVNYTGQFNEDVQSHGGSLKVTIPF